MGVWGGHSRQKEKHVQRSWGERGPGVWEKQQKDSCSWREGREAEGGSREGVGTNCAWPCRTMLLL